MGTRLGLYFVEEDPCSQRDESEVAINTTFPSHELAGNRLVTRPEHLRPGSYGPAVGMSLQGHGLIPAARNAAADEERLRLGVKPENSLL